MLGEVDWFVCDCMDEFVLAEPESDPAALPLADPENEPLVF